MKLYIVVKKTLNAGLKAAQAIHAFRQFVGEYPILESYWHAEHNNIVVLHEDDLLGLEERLRAAGYRVSAFHEPDLDGELTAICVEPAAWRVLSSLPLAA